MKVVYGHTDSIYVDIEDNDIETAEKTLKILNEHVREVFLKL
jgi:DNA polymerase elongation subunit (family B)